MAGSKRDSQPCSMPTAMRASHGVRSITVADLQLAPARAWHRHDVDGREARALRARPYRPAIGLVSRWSSENSRSMCRSTSDVRPIHLATELLVIGTGGLQQCMSTMAW